MSERKGLINYISPDFDPSLIPRQKRIKNKLTEVTNMLPFSLRCSSCGEYMYIGKKFNMKKEMVAGGDYLGIKVFRFYMKCTACKATITWKTDPKNNNYEMESGATRNFEIRRDTEQAVADEELMREEEEKQDSMKALENRALDSKIEMDILDALDEIKASNQRHERVDTTALIAEMNKKQQEDDEKLIQSIKFKGKGSNHSRSSSYNADNTVNSDTSSSSGIAKLLSVHLSKESTSIKQTGDDKQLGANIVLKKKRKIEVTANDVNCDNTTNDSSIAVSASAITAADDGGNIINCLLGGYDSD